MNWRKQLFQIFAVQRCVLERNRKLNQQRAQLPFPRQRFQSLARQGFVFIVGPDGSGRSGLHHGHGIVGERTMQLGGEHEIWIHRLGLPRPQLGQVRLDVSVKRSVDLHHVKAARQDFQRMLLAVLHSRRIENSLPVFVRPAGSANADW